MSNRIQSAWDVKPGDESDPAKEAADLARQVIDSALSADPLLLSKAALSQSVGKTQAPTVELVAPGVIKLTSQALAEPFYYYARYERYSRELLSAEQQDAEFGKLKGSREAPGTAAKSRARKKARARIARASKRRNRGA